MEMSARHSAELRQQCSVLEPANIVFDPSMHYTSTPPVHRNQSNEHVLKINEKDAIMQYLGKIVDSHSDESPLYHPDVLFTILASITIHLPCKQAYFETLVHPIRSQGIQTMRDVCMDQAPLLCPFDNQIGTSNNMPKNWWTCLLFAYAFETYDSHVLLEDVLNNVKRMLRPDLEDSRASALLVDNRCIHSHLVLPRFTHLVSCLFQVFFCSRNVAHF